MKNKKEIQHGSHPAIRNSFCVLSFPAIGDRLKGLVITFSVWGWLPLGLANWILRKEKGIDSAKHFKEIA
jgi:hypothetical protein